MCGDDKYHGCGASLLHTSNKVLDVAARAGPHARNPATGAIVWGDARRAFTAISKRAGLLT